MARLLQPVCCQNWAGSNMLDPTSRIQFTFIPQKKAPDHIVQNWPGSSLDGLVRFGPNKCGPEASWCTGVIRPPLSCILVQTAHILCKTSPDQVWFRLTVLCFGQTDPVPKQAGVQESFRPTFQSQSWSDANWIHHVYMVYYKALAIVQ